MPHFIKTGYWEKAVKTYKGWLDLEQLIASVSPPGGGGTLQQVLAAGYIATNEGIYLEGINAGINTNVIRTNDLQAFNSFYLTSTFENSITRDFSAYLMDLYWNIQVNNNTNILGTNYALNSLRLLKYFNVLSDASLQITTNSNVQGGDYFSQISVDVGDNSFFSIEDYTNIRIATDVVNNPFNTGTVEFDSSRIGIQIDDLQSPNANYGTTYGILDFGNLCWFQGYTLFGSPFTSDYNSIKTITTASFAKPVNFDNSTSSSAGSASGEYLTVYVNGVQRKIALLNV